MINRITEPATDLLYQLKKVLEKLTDEQYVRKIPVLSNASVGQHTRHIIEFYQELEKGYTTGYISYDARKRDHETETQRSCAIQQLLTIAAGIKKPDKLLVLEAGYNTGGQIPARISTSYQRELMYNIEHTVHHMALLKIAVYAVSEVELPEGFGVGVSTIKYRKTCAQ